MANSKSNTIAVFSISASGNVPPICLIAGGMFVTNTTTDDVFAYNDGGPINH